MGRVSLRKCMVILTAVFSLACYCAICEARAGGGHGFSGGGGGRGGGGGGGGGFGGGASGFSHNYGRGTGGNVGPGFGIPIFFVIAIAVVYFIYQQQKNQTVRTIQRGFSASDELERAKAIEQLQQEDPAFDPAAFCISIRKAFEKVQAGWSAMQLEPIRPFVSDGVFERFSLQMEEMKDLGYRNVVDNLRILSVQVAHVQLDAMFATVSVRIVASARDYDVSLKDGRTLRTNSTSEFAEVWSFLRRRGVKTPAAGGFALIAGNCPNCGAAVELNQHARCKQCNAVLRCGQYDWVLAEITQDSEWSPRTDARIPGLATMQGRDAAMNAQAVEDFASVVYWRKMAAERTVSDKPLRKLAANDFCDHYTKGLGQTFYANCGVGGVELRGILPGAPGQTMDRALVQVTWSGVRYLRNPQGGFSRSETGGVISQIFVLARDADARTNLDNAISSAHCPNCGGPMMQEAAPACEFCGQVLNDGRHAWILTAVLPSASTDAQTLVRQAASDVADIATDAQTDAATPVSLRAAMAIGWVIKMAFADGIIDPREEAIVYRIAQSRRVPRQQVQAMLEAAQRGEFTAPEPQDREEAKAWMELMVEAAFADGKMSPDEGKLLQDMAATQGLTNMEFNLLVNSVRNRLIQQAREVNRK